MLEREKTCAALLGQETELWGEAKGGRESGVERRWKRGLWLKKKRSLAWGERHAWQKGGREREREKVGGRRGVDLLFSWSYVL